MATGIVSIAAFRFQMWLIAETLFILNWCFYTVLAIFFLLRLIFYRKEFLSDISNHAKGAGFFTVVAGTCIIGSQFIVLRHDFGIAKVSWVIAIIFWLALVYTFFAAITIQRQKPTLEEGINGIWLVSVVATQAVSVLGTLIANHFGILKEIILFSALCLFLIGTILYFLIITLIFYRLTFFRMQADEFAPPYWINMGALAVSVLANSHLVMVAPQWQFLEEIIPFLKGTTILFWAMGTWWIPLIVILSAWRHISGQLRLVYHPQYWGMVFPLGMYTVATLQMVEALKLPFLTIVPSVFIYIALSAWLLTFVGLLRQIGRALKPFAV
ncbi:MAG: hypothetical protein LDLANPLL_02232 [Turneriella sp.]|nr:hypothetical protein [Turneriella sp.]